MTRSENKLGIQRSPQDSRMGPRRPSNSISRSSCQEAYDKRGQTGTLA